MMTLSEFIVKYKGQKVDFDNYAGPQCVDLFRQYNQDVYGNPRTEPLKDAKAKNIWLDYDNMPLEKKYLVKVEGRLRAGDILVWDTGEYGHVAILLATCGDNFIVFEQDGFKQDGAKLGLLTRKGFLGALRKRMETVL